MTMQRVYWSARTTANISWGKFNLDALKELGLGVYQLFVSRGYFQETLGYECVDSGSVLGTLGFDVSLYFFRKLKKRGLWPIDDQTIQNYSEADLFDVIELLYDLVSKPVDGTYHSWNDCGWHYTTFDKPAGQLEFQTDINDILSEYSTGFSLSDAGQIIPKQGHGTDLFLQQSLSSFASVFKYGLPISLQKPTVFMEHGEDGQKFRFDENDRVGILRGEVYPGFCMDDLAQWAEPSKRLGFYAQPKIEFDGWSHRSWTILHNLCQTNVEKTFLKAYVSKFVTPYKKPDKSATKYQLTLDWLRDKVPALIPQAWISWSSASREALSRMGYRDSSLPYRLDFVAFWNSRNYAVMIDGIEHYAEQVGNRWDAKEEKYAARLKEDRLLRIQGWHVFRVGNWEVKDITRLDQVLNELRKFLGFEEPPVPPPLPSKEENETYF